MLGNIHVSQAAFCSEAYTLHRVKVEGLGSGAKVLS